MCKDTSLMVRFKIVNAMQLPINSEGTCKHECSICYRSINKRALVCSSPCNKIYHQSCLETTIEQQEMSSVYETDAPIRCSYCRREINMSAYILDTELQYLKNLKAAGGYDVNDAIQTIIEADGVFPREGFSLEYFEIAAEVKYPRLVDRTHTCLIEGKLLLAKSIKGRMSLNRCSVIW